MLSASPGTNTQICLPGPRGNPYYHFTDADRLHKNPMPPIPTITDIAFQLRAIRVPNSTPTPAPTTATSVSTASELGIDRFFFVASTIFAVAYLFLTGWFTYQFFKKRIYHFGIVVSICGYRLGMFIFQAVLATMAPTRPRTV
ncbi:hypothetical protein BDP27DRAFT_561117 [Rhodocollybia butyracea]|uniref:Uncharacterized protein n=1 Tax=Rhodocollybia butyracea TaxID=206335 RepID=A0A9P5TYR4_9AGAR|nr:hypothetical protein BDP27DRAFT_561117 [Rhodocollybia butyracea]